MSDMQLILLLDMQLILLLGILFVLIWVHAAGVHALIEAGYALMPVAGE